MFSDGGGDHRLTFISVQLGFLSLCIKYNLSYIVAGRCAPCQSYIYHIERVMSVLNLGLQSVGVMRQEMQRGFEKQISGLYTMTDIWNKVMKDDALKNEIDSCIKPVTDLLGSTLGRLSWKGKQINIHEAASEAEIDAMFDTSRNFEPNFDKKTMQQKHLKTIQFFRSSLKLIVRDTITGADNNIVQSVILQVMRLSVNLLESLHKFTLPVPDNGDNADHY